MVSYLPSGPTADRLLLKTQVQASGPGVKTLHSPQNTTNEDAAQSTCQEEYDHAKIIPISFFC